MISGLIEAYEGTDLERYLYRILKLFPKGHGGVVNVDSSVLEEHWSHLISMEYSEIIREHERMELGEDMLDEESKEEPDEVSNESVKGREGDSMEYKEGIPEPAILESKGMSEEEVSLVKEKEAIEMIWQILQKIHPDLHQLEQI